VERAASDPKVKKQLKPKKPAAKGAGRGRGKGKAKPPVPVEGGEDGEKDGEEDGEKHSEKKHDAKEGHAETGGDASTSDPKKSVDIAALWAAKDLLLSKRFANIDSEVLTGQWLEHKYIYIVYNVCKTLLLVR